MALCEFCNTWITQPKGKKKKRFCNSTCRSNFWYGKNKKGDSKIEFVSPTPASYDGKKMNIINDEAGQWEKPLDMEEIKRNLLAEQKPQTGLFFPLPLMEAQKLMRSLIDERFDIDHPDEYAIWLEKLEASPLSRKQKDICKTTNQR